MSKIGLSVLMKFLLNIKRLALFPFPFLLVHIQELSGDIPDRIPCGKESNKKDSNENFKHIGKFIDYRVGIDDEGAWAIEFDQAVFCLHPGNQGTNDQANDRP